MMSDIPNLIRQVEGASVSLKGTVDTVLATLKGMEATMVKCQQDVAEMQDWRDQEISRMRSEVQAEAIAKAKAVREREIAERDRDKVRKDVQRLRSEYERCFTLIKTSAA
jgi:hypothetical protein